MSMFNFNVFPNLKNLMGRKQVAPKDTDAQDKDDPRDDDYWDLAGSVDPLYGWISSLDKKWISDRVTRFDKYEEMDEDEIVSGALDAYAEESTQRDIFNQKVVWFESKNDGILDILEKFKERLQLDSIITSIARTSSKFGNDYELMVGGPKDGIVRLANIHPLNCVRVEQNGVLKGFRITNKEDILPPWAICHFRLPPRDRGIYGDSVLRSSIRAYTRLKFMESSMVLYRLRRAPDRNIFYIDVGNATGDRALRIVNKFKRQFRKKTYFDQKMMDTKDDPLTSIEDIFWPMNTGSGSKVDVLKGTNNVDTIYDIEYQLNKLLSGLRIPPSYFGLGTGTYGAEKTLSSQDRRFARKCQVVQSSMIYGIIQMAQIELTYKGIDALSDDSEFFVRMAPISYTEEILTKELQELRLQSIKSLIEIGKNLNLDQNTWVPYVLENYGKFTELEIMKFLPKEDANVIKADTPEAKATESKIPNNSAITKLVADTVKKVLKEGKRSTRLIAEANGMVSSHNIRVPFTKSDIESNKKDLQKMEFGEELSAYKLKKDRS